MSRSNEYRDLLKQREALDAKIAAAQAEGKPQAIEEARDLIATFALTEKDLFGPAPGAKGGRGGSRGPAAPKYRHPDTGATWSGRGKAPAWIEGDREKYLIADPA